MHRDERAAYRRIIGTQRCHLTDYFTAEDVVGDEEIKKKHLRVPVRKRSDLKEKDAAGGG